MLPHRLGACVLSSLHGWSSHYYISTWRWSPEDLPQMPHGCRQHQLHISHSQSEQDSMSLPPGVGLTLSSILERQPHSSGGRGLSLIHCYICCPRWCCSVNVSCTLGGCAPAQSTRSSIYFKVADFPRIAPLETSQWKHKSSLKRSCWKLTRSSQAWYGLCPWFQWCLYLCFWVVPPVVNKPKPELTHWELQCLHVKWLGAMT